MNKQIGRLRALWWGAVAGGLLCAAVVALVMGVFDRFDWFPAIMAVSTGACAFGGFFFIGANLAGVRFEQRVRDETKVRGSTVEHITHVAPSGDEQTDAWLDRYVFARNLFGGLVVPLLIFAGLILFTG